MLFATTDAARYSRFLQTHQFVEEAEVEQVHNGVFDTTNVDIHRQPVVSRFGEITWKTFDLHENEPAWNIRTEHEGMFTEMGIKIKALIARKLPGDETVTWIEPKVLKKMAAAEAAAAEAAAHGETADA